ncbi:STAS/SEC14 domain-containing protein [Nitratireductor sp. CH_MIT9313-5]|uniref:STAS/SEC14 domain-containing protein n=1 Tax=Nitratireductor sp. CH_MIT9313-5 TaxID=3107764 RepID=UPI0030086BDF
MLNNETPHVKRIETSREDAVAFEVTGHITTADIENLYGLLDGIYVVHEKIDLLVLIHHYEGFDWNAALREGTIAGKTKALKHVRKYALIGGPSWMGTTLALFRPFLSIDMKHFDLDEQEHAWKWLGAEPRPIE